MSKSPEGRDRIPDEEDIAEVPLTMAASVILTNLPRDATKALESAGDLGMQKSRYFRGA
jgi:ubiquitin-like protein ATG12